MTERDEYDEAAIGIWTDGPGAVAAALRKQAWINDAVYQGMEKEIAELKAKLAEYQSE